MALGHTQKGTLYGCHELEVYPNDRLTCGSGQALMLFDMSGAFDDNGTPADFTDDKPRGTPLPCRVRDATTTPGFGTGAKVTDCVDGNGEGTDDLHVSKWLAAGAPWASSTSARPSTWAARRRSRASRRRFRRPRTSTSTTRPS
jgi:hypothetical protein